MANELAHTPLVADADGFVRLRQTDYESLTAHALKNGVAGDGVGYDGSKLVRVSGQFNSDVFNIPKDGVTDADAATQTAITALGAA